MTNLPVPNSAPSNKTPVSAKDRLAQILDAAQQLHTNAEWLQIEAADLFFDLKSVTPEPTGSGYSVAVTAAAWLDDIAASVEAEAQTLVDCLFATIDEAEPVEQGAAL